MIINIGDLITDRLYGSLFGIVLNTIWDKEYQDWFLEVRWLDNEENDWAWATNCKKVS